MNSSLLPPPPQIPHPLASDNRILSLCTRGGLLSAHFYRDRGLGAEKWLLSFGTVKMYSNLYRKRTPESSLTRVGSKELAYHRGQIGAHLHTRPTNLA